MGWDGISAIFMNLLVLSSWKLNIAKKPESTISEIEVKIPETT